MKSLYSVFDQVSKLWGLPFHSHNNKTAVRDFATAAQDPNTQIAKNPADYQLYCVGSFDESSGVIISTSPDLIGSASQYLE